MNNLFYYYYISSSQLIIKKNYLDIYVLKQIAQIISIMNVLTAITYWHCYVIVQFIELNVGTFNKFDILQYID